MYSSFSFTALNGSRTRFACLLLAAVFLVSLRNPVAGQPGNVSYLIPAGFTVLDSAGTDVDSDGDRDLFLILEKSGDSTGEAERPFLILVNDDTAYKVVKRNDHIVLCRSCGGVMGDPYQAIVAKKNYFSIEHYGGSSWRWTRVITFRYDKKRKEFLLHKDSGTSFHASEPAKEKQMIYNKGLAGKQLFDAYTNERW